MFVSEHPSLISASLSGAMGLLPLALSLAAWYRDAAPPASGIEGTPRHQLAVMERPPVAPTIHFESMQANHEPLRKFGIGVVSGHDLTSDVEGVGSELNVFTRGSGTLRGFGVGTNAGMRLPLVADKIDGGITLGLPAQLTHFGAKSGGGVGAVLSSMPTLSSVRKVQIFFIVLGVFVFIVRQVAQSTSATARSSTRSNGAGDPLDYIFKARQLEAARASAPQA